MTKLLLAFVLSIASAQTPTLVEQLVGMSIDSNAVEGTVVMLDESQLTPDEARRILGDLQALPYFLGAADSIDNIERLMFLNTVTKISRGELDPETMKWIGGGEALGRHDHDGCADARRHALARGDADGAGP